MSPSRRPYGVGDGVRDRVGVGMADEPFTVGNLYAAEDQLAARGEGVGVVADADAHLGEQDHDVSKITLKSGSFATRAWHQKRVLLRAP